MFLGLQDILSRTFVELHYSNVFLEIAVLPVQFILRTAGSGGLASPLS
jgi:hypothetical protein